MKRLTAWRATWTNALITLLQENHIYLFLMHVTVFYWISWGSLERDPNTFNKSFHFKTTILDKKNLKASPSLSGEFARYVI